ncbi:MAG: hypothetical protein SGARI_006215, partial [Bacillariaceae sp.]
MGWFGSNKSGTSSSKKKTAPIDASMTIMRLRENISNQEKREEMLQVRITKMADLAKLQMRKGDKRAALSTMKKRKLYENEMAKIDNVKLTLETQCINLEGAAQNVQTFDAMKSGNKSMMGIRKSMGVDNVDDMLDDIKEEMDLLQEVNGAFSQPIDPFGCDDDDLLAELDALEMESMPAAPSKTPSLW